MAKERRIYSSGNRWKKVLFALSVIILVVIILAVAVFFGFRKYIVYTSDGIRLEVPWLEETQPDNAQY